jgi:hypothetical protein
MLNIVHCLRYILKTLSGLVSSSGVSNWYRLWSSSVIKNYATLHIIFSSRILSALFKINTVIRLLHLVFLLLFQNVTPLLSHHYCVLYVSYPFMLTYPVSQKYLQEITREKLLKFMLQNYHQLVKSYLSCVDWLETSHNLGWERILILSEILVETTVMIDFKCPSDKHDCIFILLFIRGENYSHV